MNAIDLFSGAGGLTLALKDSGFDVLLANEVNAQFAETHSYNFPDIPLILEDIKKLEKDEIETILNGRCVDLVVGGPP